MTSYKNLTYEWMHKQIEELEKAVLNQCAFCTGNGVKLQPLEFNTKHDIKSREENKDIKKDKKVSKK